MKGSSSSVSPLTRERRNDSTRRRALRQFSRACRGWASSAHFRSARDTNAKRASAPEAGSASSRAIRAIGECAGRCSRRFRDSATRPRLPLVAGNSCGEGVGNHESHLRRQQAQAAAAIVSTRAILHQPADTTTNYFSVHVRIDFLSFLFYHRSSSQTFPAVRRGGTFHRGKAETGATGILSSALTQVKSFFVYF